MRYKDDIAKSAEHMRLAIPLMAKQAAGFHPVSYSVWYEVVSGINSGLKAEVEEITGKGCVLDNATTAALFRKHIAEIDEKTAQRISSGFQQVLANVSQSTSEASDQASRFSNSLDKWSGNAGETRLTEGVTQLKGEAHEMKLATMLLQDRLAESHQEIENLRQEVSRARGEALSDGLTGLTNRKGFDQAMAQCLSEAEQHGKMPSILIADIDHFKKVNDTYGHLFGDKVICSIADVLKKNIKGKDTAARYGGEEFVILLPDTPVHGALALAEYIRSTIEGSVIRRVVDNVAVSNITVSIGVASYRKNESVSDFIGRADQALYESKRQGRNRITSAIATQ